MIRRVLLITLLTILGSTAQAFVDSKDRVVILTDKHPATQFSVFETDGQHHRYRVALIDYMQQENGSLKTTSGRTSNSAVGYLRYSPRVLDINPAKGGSEMDIALQVRKFKNLPDGEYRSHLLIQELPGEVPLEKVKTPKKEKNLALKLNLIYGSAFPVLVRKGNLSATVSMTDVHVEKGGKANVLSLTLKNAGTLSPRGNIRVEDSDGKLLAEGKNVAVYLPNRTVHLRLPLEKGAKAQGDATITYTNGDQTFIKKTVKL